MSDGWGEFGQKLTHAFIQWKGTDACFDFICECGEQCHWDGYFAYAVKCPNPECGIVWEMPYILYPRKADPSTGWGGVVVEPEREGTDGN